ncbi:MAG: IS110 family transposase [Pirellulaceae bacterium]
MPILHELPQSQSPSTTHNAILVGIDWADAQHAYHAILPDGSSKSGSFKQNRKSIDAWIIELRALAPNAAIDICIETSTGGLINALLECEGLVIYPVNPNALASYRKAFAHGGGKNDPVDARLIAQFLQHYRSRLRPLRINSPETRELDVLTSDRRDFVQQRVKLANRLTDKLKTYFPAIFELKPARTYSEFVVDLVAAYPTLQEAQAAGRTKLRKLFYGKGTKEKIEKRLQIIMEATPLSSDPVLLRTAARQCRVIAKQIQQLNASIKQYDDEIKRFVKQHADYAIVEHLPGASFRTHARIIAALGDDRSRYANAESLQCATGIAPITTQSGKSRFVSARSASSKFIRQTFHEYASLSIRKCAWAKAYYESQLAKGKSSQTAKRALAFKWIRIIFRLWQTRTAYDESRYLERLKATQSPLAIKLSTTP